MEVGFIRRSGVRGGDGRSLVAFVRRIAAAAGCSADEVTVVLTGDDEIAELNRRYRRKPAATDVLSFPGGEDPDGVLRQGDVVISVETARRQARRRRHSLEEELRYLLIHGFLHLMGYDHETDDGEMNREELRLRRRLLAPSAPEPARSPAP